MKLVPLLLGALLAPGIASADLTPKKAGAATFVCGGVGQAEQQQMKAAEPGYDMLLTFATSNGAYQADVDVQIADARGGIVLSTHCAGPLMLVDLPVAGTWNILARAGGALRTATVKTGGGLARPVFTWPAS